MKKRILSILLVAVVGVLPVIQCSYNRTETAATSLLCFREYQSWQEDVTLDDRTSIKVEHRHSHDWSVAFGHLLEIGSGDDHFSVAQFSIPPGKCRWAVTRDERPIVLRLHHGKPWMVTFDRTDMSNIVLRSYTFDDAGLATEVAAAAVPKHLAIQNMWLSSKNGLRAGKPIDQYEIVAALDPRSYDFQESLTAKMWRWLDRGIPHSSRESITADFLADYKAKYLPQLGVGADSLQ